MPIYLISSKMRLGGPKRQQRASNYGRRQIEDVKPKNSKVPREHCTLSNTSTTILSQEHGEAT